VVWQPEEDPVLSPIDEQALFRVVQEALTNVARHAEATQVKVELTVTPNTVKLFITDDGKGFDMAAIQTKTTMGLQGMQERLVGLGGTLSVETVPGAGTQLIALLPRSDSTKDGESNA